MAKVKQRREDFVVREVTNLRLADGDFSVYRLEKSGIGTSEAMQRIARAWDLSNSQLRFGGRKDRHAITSQTVTILNGPAQDFEAENFSLRYLGSAAAAMNAKAIVANDFELTIRDLDALAAERVSQTLQNANFAIPNYFDLQRFGSVTSEGNFAAVPWCLGDYEKAVYYALAEHTPQDSAPEREQRAILRDHWKDWPACKARLDRSNRRSVVTYLVDHPEGFKKAAGLIQRDMRSIYVSALQSRIWNETVSRIIQESLRVQSNDGVQSNSDVQLQGDPIHAGGTLRIQKSPAGSLAYPASAEAVEGLGEMPQLPTHLPLPSARPTKWPEGIREKLNAVCAEFGLTLHKLRLSYPRDVFFSRAARPTRLIPERVECEIEADELSDAEKSKAVLRFRLQPGQYATTVIKSLMLICNQQDDDDAALA
ncbi:MAG: tRNA pseudouridine(13) synthase TruD [Aureliella sp.]